MVEGKTSTHYITKNGRKIATITYGTNSTHINEYDPTQYFDRGQELKRKTGVRINTLKHLENEIRKLFLN